MVCAEHHKLWKDCKCGGDKWTWILVNDKELAVFYDTGLVPDWESELLWCEGQPKPEPKPLQFPPTFSFYPHYSRK